MPSLHQRALTSILALTTVFAVAACDDASEPLAPDVAPQSVLSAMRGGAGTPASGMRVFTRNIFLGGDTGPLFSLDFPDPGNEPPQETIAKTLALLAGVNTFWGQVQATDFAQRAEAIADEVASTDPHVVALQEVARYAVVDLTAGQPVVVGGVDFLGTLQAELAGRGLSYDLVVLNPFVEGQLPLGIDLTTFQFTRILDLSVGEATLVRSDVKVLDSDQGNYQVGLDLGPLSLDRGWSHVRVKFAGMPYHVVNTHLETQGIRPVHDAQASELIGSVLAGLHGMTVLVGDLNSDALGPQNNSNPAWTPTYGRLLAAGFADAWLQVADDQGDGATCCFDPDLADPDASVLDERIDFVLVRRPGNGNASAGAAQASVRWMTVLGDENGDQTIGGLWPADHAGLFAELYFPGVVANN
ncbi:MAG: hypothetical protein HKN73_05570 [Gemmatimonadetes bacterium]|nr:hypothetical protein [Gemmatimonadota bacterium]